MSLADFDDRELDQLADYAAGVLDPQSAAQVQHLVATDPAWAAALAELTEADSAVRAQLYVYGHGSPQPMPADVAARLDAALSAEARRTSRAADSGVVVSLDAARLARRRRVARLAVAAAAVIVVGVGIPVALKTAGMPTSNNSATSAGADAQSGNAAGVAPPEALNLPGVTVTATGRNYTTSTLADAAGAAAVPAPSAALTSATSAAPGAGGNTAKSATPPGSVAAGSDSAGVSRDPAVLSDCLAAIAAVHPGQAVSVDYARYDSQPAVIVVVVQATGRLVVAAGPRCGLNGADELASARG